jgi:hypothetical protein
MAKKPRRYRYYFEYVYRTVDDLPEDSMSKTGLLMRASNRSEAVREFWEFVESETERNGNHDFRIVRVNDKPPYEDEAFPPKGS